MGVRNVPDDAGPDDGIEPLLGGTDLRAPRTSQMHRFPPRAMHSTCLACGFAMSTAAATSRHQPVSTQQKSQCGVDTPDTSTYRPESTPATEFEQKLKVVRDGHFAYVWVFSRLDGKAFTPEDTQLLHTNAPKVVDWVGMDDK